MMSAAKVFIFAPADPTEETHKMLQEQGCELVLGKASCLIQLGQRAQTGRTVGD
jgi:hypothetical protein